MICNKCNSTVDANSNFCPNCGQFFTTRQNQIDVSQMGFNQCEKCGYVGTFELEKVLRKKDWIIGLLTIPIGGFGLVYLLTTSIERKIGNKRGLQCPACNYVHKPNKKSKTTLDNVSKTAKNLATDKNFQNNIKDVGRALRDFRDSLG
ncbi:MAG: hypothetical protein IJ447_02715 [Clostridia bacterium]|nr:hypothetical protein [Clostridia bacterium]